MTQPVAALEASAGEDVGGDAAGLVADAAAFLEAEDAGETTVAAGSVAPASATQSWIPTRPGTRSTYQYVRERSRSVRGQESEIEKLRGTLIEEVAPAEASYGSEVVRVDSKLQVRSASSQHEVHEHQSHYYRVNGSRIELVAERKGDPTQAKDLVTRYDVPLSIFEAGAEPGQRWEVGVQSERDLHTQLEGEVLGVQAVDTPAGRFEQCLVIRLTGEIEGVVEAYGTRMEVPSGEVSMTRWYAPGHGLVLAKEVRSQTLVLEDGTEMDYSERTQYALRSSDTPIASVVDPAEHDGTEATGHDTPAAPAPPLEPLDRSPEVAP